MRSWYFLTEERFLEQVDRATPTIKNDYLSYKATIHLKLIMK